MICLIDKQVSRSVSRPVSQSVDRSVAVSSSFREGREISRLRAAADLPLSLSLSLCTGDKFTHGATGSLIDVHTVAARAAAPCPKLKAAAQAPHIACGGPLRWIFLNRYRNDLRLLPNEFAYTNTGGQTDRQTDGETVGQTVGQIGSFPFTQLLLLFLFWAPSLSLSLHQVGGNLWLSISDMMRQNVAASSTRPTPSLSLFPLPLSIYFFIS